MELECYKYSSISAGGHDGSTRKLNADWSVIVGEEVSSWRQRPTRAAPPPLPPLTSPTPPRARSHRPACTGRHSLVLMRAIPVLCSCYARAMLVLCSCYARADVRPTRSSRSRPADSPKDWPHPQWTSSRSLATRCSFCVRRASYAISGCAHALPAHPFRQCPAPSHQPPASHLSCQRRAIPSHPLISVPRHPDFPHNGQPP